MNTRGALARPTTQRAPHVRRPGDLRGSFRCVLLALLPCLLVGLHNTGRQANRALAELGLAGARGWRGRLLAALGVGPDSDSLLDCTLHGAAWFVPLLAVSALTALACAQAFARLRGRRPGPGLAVTVGLYSLCLPPGLPLWQAAFGCACGVIVGRELFGGTGRNLLNPALTGLALLYVSFPQAFRAPGIWTAVDGTTGATALGVAALGGLPALASAGFTWRDAFLGQLPGAFGETSTLACLLGAGFLIARRVVDWRIPLGAGLGLVGATLLLQLGDEPLAPAASLPWFWQLTLGGFAFGVIFMASDPVSSAMTAPGRWLYGLLIGVLVLLIRVQNPQHAEGVLFAILLGNLLAPLIDHVVVLLHLQRRRRRHA